MDECDEQRFAAILKDSLAVHQISSKLCVSTLLNIIQHLENKRNIIDVEVIDHDSAIDLTHKKASAMKHLSLSLYEISYNSNVHT